MPKKPLNKKKSKDLHPRNLHNRAYDFVALVDVSPRLKSFVRDNGHGQLSIDFANSQAVIELNKALLNYHYKIVDWNIPQGALCPPIPGRVDYIHYAADLIGEKAKVRMLDLGIGANGIYALLAAQIYGWECIGSDINQESLHNVSAILQKNPQLAISLRHQPDKNCMFKNIISEGEFFDITVCNPPFHESAEEARKGSLRKMKNLAKNRGEKMLDSKLNFGGQANELWCKGGERLFLKKMIKESKDFAKQCHWFTSLVSKSENLAPSKKLIAKLGAKDIRVIEMKQGNKITRILAWTYS